MPMPRLCGGTLSMRWPLRWISPWVADSKPASIIRQVVLPDPDGPEHRQEFAAGDVEVEILDDERLAVIALLHAIEVDVGARFRAFAGSALRLHMFPSGHDDPPIVMSPRRPRKAVTEVASDAISARSETDVTADTPPAKSATL